MDWTRFYEMHAKELGEPSNFARFVSEHVRPGDELVDLGAGNGKDVKYFKEKSIDAYGIDDAFESEDVIKLNVKDYIRKNPSPKYVYTRFFWHSIDRETQLSILDWTKDTLFIEARTSLDIPDNIFCNKKRNLVFVSELVKDLKSYGFDIVFATEGRGLSPFLQEDPHLIRIICKKI